MTTPARPATARGELVVVTGMTGAGRSTAAKELEDLGCFVVDNLPPEPAAATWSGWSTRAAASSSRSRSSSTSAPARSSTSLQANLAAGRDRPAHHAALPRGHRRRAGPPAGGRPPPAPAPGRRPAARRPAARARGARRPARRRRPGHRHLQPQRAPAHRPDRRGVRHRRTSTRPARSPWSASASSTASRSTPTSSPTCASCPTRTGSPSCAPLHRPRRRGRRLRLEPARRRGVPRRSYVPVLETRRRRATCARASGS